MTDEDAFRFTRKLGAGIVVRGEDDERETLAQLSLGDPGEVRELLDRLGSLLARLPTNEARR